MRHLTTEALHWPARNSHFREAARALASNHKYYAGNKCKLEEAARRVALPKLLRLEIHLRGEIANSSKS